MRRRPILFLIDVEPTARLTREAGDAWRSSNDALELFVALRAQLETATRLPVRFNWFLRTDPQIQQTWGRSDYISVACPGTLREIAAHDDFTGVHVHLWRWHAERREWFNDFTDSEWTAECVRTSIDGYRRIFNRAPAACRFGDRWLSQHAIDLVRAAGLRYDLTIEPGLPPGPVWDDPQATAPLPDYRAAPRRPYVPSRSNYLVPRADPSEPGDFWMLPLSTSPARLHLSRRPPFLVKRSVQPNLMRPTDEIWPLIRDELARADARSPLVVVVRSGDLEADTARRHFLATTGLLARHAALARCEFTTPADAVARLINAKTT